MSEKSAYIHEPWNFCKDDPWQAQTETFQGNGMTFKELQKQYPLDYHFNRGREWKLERTSKRGNRVMRGVHVKSCDNLDGFNGGKAYSYDVTAIVRPNGEVAQYTVVYDDWDY